MFIFQGDVNAVFIRGSVINFFLTMCCNTLSCCSGVKCFKDQFTDMINIGIYLLRDLMVLF